MMRPAISIGSAHQQVPIHPVTKGLSVDSDRFIKVIGTHQKFVCVGTEEFSKGLGSSNLHSIRQAQSIPHLFTVVISRKQNFTGFSPSDRAPRI